MYIINQDNTKIVEMIKIEIDSKWSYDIQNQLDEIYNRIKSKEYNYGNSENCRKAIKEEQDKYLKDKIKQYIIYVNDNNFAIYKNKKEADIEFENIRDAIIQNKNAYKLK